MLRKELHIDTATIAALKVGDEVSRKLGGDLDLDNAYGTPETPPVPRSTAWGLRATKPSDHPDLASTLARTDPPVLVRIDPAASCCSESCSAWRLARANDPWICDQFP